MLNVVIHAADVQDRDGARLVLDRRTRRLFPFIERIFADAGYQGPALAGTVAKTGTSSCAPVSSGMRLAGVGVKMAQGGQACI